MKWLIILVSILSLFQEIEVKDIEEAEIQTETTYVVCIDPGHQLYENLDLEENGPGSDVLKAKVSQGTRGLVSGVYEHEINLAVALKVKKILLARGYQVVMTREEADVDISNKERALIANDHQAALFLRIHADHASDLEKRGISVLYPQGQVDLAQIMLDHMLLSTGAQSQGLYLRGDITGFNWCQGPSVLVEMGFMSNREDDKLLNDDTYQDKLAQGIADGVDEYLMGKVHE